MLQNRLKGENAIFSKIGATGEKGNRFSKMAVHIKQGVRCDPCSNAEILKSKLRRFSKIFGDFRESKRLGRLRLIGRFSYSLSIA